MYRYETIRRLHLEITSRCNAACPLCPRNVLGGQVNPTLPIAELTLKDIKTIFPPDFIRRLNVMYMCGNYGDPMIAQDALAVFRYFRACHPNIYLGIHTNGSGRNPKWWRQLAKVVNYCRFGIDGLEDTNHLYRRNTHWDTIMKSVTAFIEAGGNAEWDFIVFRHNEHQVETARALSRQLGFSKFFVKKSGRFLNVGTGQIQKQVEVVDSKGQMLYTIEISENTKYFNTSLVQFVESLKGQNSHTAYLDRTTINCKTIDNQELYVSAEGLVFPCCWTANIYPAWYQPTGSVEMWHLINQLVQGKDAINAQKFPLKQIIDGPFFQQLIPESWSKNRIEEGKLKVCSQMCGKYDVFTAQYNDQKADIGNVG